MAAGRAFTPPPSSLTIKIGCEALPPPISTPGTNDGRFDNGNMIMGSEHATVPPSPGNESAAASASPTVPTVEIRAIPRRIRKAKSKQRARTGAGIKKAIAKKKTDGALARLVAAASVKKPLEKAFGFTDLPGEIRNMIYEYTCDNPKQALLVHRPRMSSLRQRTRLDRTRTLASDIAGKEHDSVLSDPNTKKPSPLKNGPLPRDTNRPFFGLTQVCKLIRHEYRPIYLQKQEVGMDLTEMVEYIRTFYYDAPDLLSKLQASRKVDLPYTGNLTIAVGNKVNEKELCTEGIEINPLLDIWANSFKIEAGFGRYMKAQYVPENDGEAKDLYRLFGRCVLPNRSCSQMNMIWRTILRSRALASVRIHRQPGARRRGAGVVGSVPSRSGMAFVPLRNPVKPYIHIIFKKEYAESWMNKFDSRIPTRPDWLAARGFGGMEYFDIKVGVAL